MVEDTGIGIKEKNFNDVFKLFRISKKKKNNLRINKSSSHNFGIYISKKLSQHLAPKNDSGLDFTSEYNVGTKFFFTLKNKYNERIRKISIKIEEINMIITNKCNKIRESIVANKLHSYCKACK